VRYFFRQDYSIIYSSNTESNFATFSILAIQIGTSLNMFYLHRQIVFCQKSTSYQKKGIKHVSISNIERFENISWGLPFHPLLDFPE
jgi:hypothetical protein